jgi:hypothetical protein
MSPDVNLYVVTFTGWRGQRDRWMIPFGGAVVSGLSQGMCSLARLSDALGSDHSVAQFFDFHVNMFG